MFRASIVVVPCLLLAACAGGPAGRPVAAVPAEKCTIDPVHSTVTFELNHLGASRFSGRFNEVKGKWAIDPANPAACSIEVTIPAGSIDTNSSDRDQHLEGPEFFNAAKFPELRFKSRAFEATSASTYQITGDLTMVGVTKPITTEARYIGSIVDHAKFKSRSGYQARFIVNRSEFGMSALAGLLGEEVEVCVNLEGIRE